MDERRCYQKVYYLSPFPKESPSRSSSISHKVALGCLAFLINGVLLFCIILVWGEWVTVGALFLMLIFCLSPLPYLYVSRALRTLVAVGAIRYDGLTGIEKRSLNMVTHVLRPILIGISFAVISTPICWIIHTFVEDTLNQVIFSFGVISALSFLCGRFSGHKGQRGYSSSGALGSATGCFLTILVLTLIGPLSDVSGRMAEQRIPILMTATLAILITLFAAMLGAAGASYLNCVREMRTLRKAVRAVSEEFMRLWGYK